MKSPQIDVIESRPFLVIVMGVSGSGKTTIAKKLSELNDFQFLEGDDYHSKSALDKMANGIALEESDRRPWIRSMCRDIQELAKTNTNCCLSYSGLKASHRKQFTELGCRVVIIHLSASRDVLEKRIISRTEHFFDASLLDSQFEALELPTERENVFVVSVDESIDDTLTKAQQILLRELLLQESSTRDCQLF